MFKGRKLLIATKHQKEKVIQPIVEKELGVTCFTSGDFDTDLLGTFSGEVDRKDDSLTTVRKKCLLAMDMCDCDLAIANEGSFGPHPTYHFITADDEFIIFIDKKNNLEIIARELSLETNFTGSDIKNDKELDIFIEQAKFPSHGVIIKKAKDDYSHIVKDITDYDELKSTFNFFIANYGKAFVETDMRAMNNPTRMEVIQTAAIKLCNKINSLCPNCKMPGFAVTGIKEGLPCELCNFPTKSVLYNIYQCNKCQYIKEEKYPNGKYAENPMYCDVCNP